MIATPCRDVDGGKMVGDAALGVPGTRAFLNCCDIYIYMYVYIKSFVMISSQALYWGGLHLEPKTTQPSLALFIYLLHLYLASGLHHSSRLLFILTTAL